MLVLRGGGSLPLRFGWLSVSPPLMALEVSLDGLSIRVRGALFGKLFGDRASWGARWDEIDRVFVARRSVFVVPNEGAGCRFLTFSPRPIVKLLEALHEHGVETVSTRTTIFNVFKLRSSDGR